MAKKKTDLTARLKELEGATGDHRRNVGNYTESLRKATGVQGVYTQGTKAMATAQAVTNLVVGKSTGAMKLFRIALASTGIGFLILALGSLYSYLTQTQEGINLVNRALTPLKVLFQSLKGVSQEVGKALVSAFLSPKQAMQDIADFVKNNLINRFKAFGVILQAIEDRDWGKLKDGLLQGATGVTDLTEKVNKMGSDANKFFQEAIDRGKEIEGIRQRLSATEADYIKRQSELKREFEEQKKISEDTTKTIAERENAAREAIDSQGKLRNLAVDRLDLEARLIELQQKSNDTDDAGRAELATKMAEIQDRYANEAAKTTEGQNKLNSIIKEGFTQRIGNTKKVIDELVKNQEIELQLFQEQNRFEEDRLAVQRQTSAKELEIIKTKFDNKLLSEKDYQVKKLAIENNLKEQELEAEQTELERIQNFEDKKKDLQEQMRIANAESDLERAELKAELDFEKHIADLEQMELLETEKTELLALLETQREEVLSEIRNSFEEQRLEKFKQVMEKDIAIREKNAQEAANVASQLTGILSGLLGDSLAAKLASIAVDAAIQAGLVSITTASSQARNLAQATATLPPPGNIPFIAAALGQNAIMQTQSSAAITKIIGSAAIQGLGTAVQSMKKMESGGLVEIGGKRHSAGGTKFYGDDGTTFEAEQGELIGVVNRRAAAMVQNLNSTFPVNGGLRSANYFAAGGFVQRGANGPSVNAPSIDYDLLAQKLGDQFRFLPQPVVAVEDINTGQNNYAEVVNGANI